MNAEGHTAEENRVLVVAPTRRDAEVTCALLGKAGLVCVACAGVASLVIEMAQGVGVVVLTDHALIDPAIDALRAALQQQPPWSDVPTLILAREHHHSPQTMHALSGLTNVTMLDLPSSTRALVSTVRSALRSRRRQYQMRDHLGSLRNAEQALVEADQRKDAFLATLAHELRNPLAAISTGLQVITRSPLDPARSARMVAMMGRQSRLLVKLIDELLDVSRIATGKVVLSRERVDLRTVLESALEIGQTAFETAAHDVRLDVSAGPVWVIGDPARLVQVVSNLLNNAAKYTPDGGRIEISLGREDSDAVIRVSDNGTGIPASMLERVFDMFTQVNRTLDRAQGGLGIGLSLVKRLMELHGGTVRAASAGVGRGSTFEVRMHTVEAEPVATLAPAPQSERDPTPAGRRLRVLVVDDNADVADSFAVLLEHAGHRTRTEYTGAAAVQAAREFHPDIVFCDIGLPGLSGHDVAARLRADARNASTVLVAVTGWGGDEDKRRTRNAGFDLHLTKPVNADAVQEILARV